MLDTERGAAQRPQVIVVASGRRVGGEAVPLAPPQRLQRAEQPDRAWVYIYTAMSSQAALSAEAAFGLLLCGLLCYGALRGRG